jgi:hypothetical protein
MIVALALSAVLSAHAFGESAAAAWMDPASSKVILWPPCSAPSGGSLQFVDAAKPRAGLVSDHALNEFRLPVAELLSFYAQRALAQWKGPRPVPDAALARRLGAYLARAGDQVASGTLPWPPLEPLAFTTLGQTPGLVLVFVGDGKTRLDRVDALGPGARGSWVRGPGTSPPPLEAAQKAVSSLVPPGEPKIRTGAGVHVDKALAPEDVEVAQGALELLQPGFSWEAESVDRGGIRYQTNLPGAEVGRAAEALRKALPRAWVRVGPGSQRWIQLAPKAP